MGMSRQTYERRFRELYDEVVRFVNSEIQEWRGWQIEVRINQISPERIVYVVEWQGQPLNAFALELLYCNGYPYIALHYDQHSHTIWRLPLKPRRKKAEFDQLGLLLTNFLEDALMTEAKRIALKEGLFAKVKNRCLFVPIGDTDFRIYYSRKDHSWWVAGQPPDPHRYECEDYHPLEFFSHLLKALVLQHSL
jgi:hypothetical protein